MKEFETITRRRLLLASVCSCGLPSLALAQFPGQSVAHPPSGSSGGTISPGTSNDAWAIGDGCALRGSPSASQLSASLTSRCFADPYLNRLINLEPQVLTSVFGVSADFACFDDSGSPNALATSRRLLGNADGTVLFGQTLLRQDFGLDLQGTSVVGIMAHEWAHIRQFKTGDQRSVTSKELHADCCAGWYLGWKFAGGMPINAWAFWQSLFEKGDYQFNNPNHHGTPKQRVDAMRYGFQIAASSTYGATSMTAVRQLFSQMYAYTRTLF